MTIKKYNILNDILEGRNKQEFCELFKKKELFD